MRISDAAALLRYGDAFSEEYYEAVDMAINALEKQEPVKPTFTREIEFDMSHWDCGACGAFIWGNAWPNAPKESRPRYCSYCGRSVKWE